MGVFFRIGAQSGSRNPVYDFQRIKGSSKCFFRDNRFERYKLFFAILYRDFGKGKVLNRKRCFLKIKKTLIPKLFVSLHLNDLFGGHPLARTQLVSVMPFFFAAPTKQ